MTRRGSETMQLSGSIPVQTLRLEGSPPTWTERLWYWTKEILQQVTEVWLEPVLDPDILLVVSIALLVLDRVSPTPSELHERLDEAIRMRMALDNMNVPPMESDGSDLEEFTWAKVLPLMGTGILVLAGLACSAREAEWLAPLWLRLLLPHSTSVMWLYLLLLLFLIESMALVCMALMGWHAIVAFHVLSKEDLSVLFSATCVWAVSLLASSYARFNFYSSIGA